ncbi:MAG: TetR/AcrR family transcriptional regulator [Desulfovibrionaceae bacterium]
MTTDRTLTRQALIDAAAALFAEHGYDAVSTRMIATAAGVNLGGIHYHFGGKQQLYVEAYRMATASDDRITLDRTAREHPELMASPQGQARIILLTVRAMFEDFLCAKDNALERRLIVREIVSPSSALPILMREIFNPNINDNSAFIRHVRPGLDEDTVFIWVNTILAPLIFYLLAATPLGMARGTPLDAAYYAKAATETARALTLLLQLPLPEESQA